VGGGLCSGSSASGGGDGRRLEDEFVLLLGRGEGGGRVRQKEYSKRIVGGYQWRRGRDITLCDSSLITHHPCLITTLITHHSSLMRRGGRG